MYIMDGMNCLDEMKSDLIAFIIPQYLIKYFGFIYIKIANFNLCFMDKMLTFESK